MSRTKALEYYKIGKALPQGSKESQFYFDLSIQSDNTFSYSYFEKSVPYNKRGDYSKGFELLNKAVELNPKMHLGYRGWLRFVKLKDYYGCISDLETLLKLTPNKKIAWGNNIQFLLAQSYYSIGQTNIALVNINIAINQNPNEELHYYIKGLIDFRLQNSENACESFSKCTSLNKDFVEAFLYLGKLKSKICLKKDAIYFFKKAKNLYLKGYKYKNNYNEVINEIYLSDIKIELTKLKH